MPVRYVALLRGINVGAAKRVPMAELRAALASLGHGEVRTLLNSGNAVFTAARRPAARAAEAIEDEVERRTGVRARATVLSDERFRAIADADPLRAVATDPSRHLVAFLRQPLDDAARGRLAALAARTWAPEALAVGADAAYLWCPDGISRGMLAEAVDRALRDFVTARNRATVEKLVALL